MIVFTFNFMCTKLSGGKKRRTLEIFFKREIGKKNVISESMLHVIRRKGKSRNVEETIIYIHISEVSLPFSLVWI